MRSQNSKKPAECRRYKGAKLGVPGEDAALPSGSATPSHGTSSGINLLQICKTPILTANSGTRSGRTFLPATDSSGNVGCRNSAAQQGPARRCSGTRTANLYASGARGRRLATIEGYDTEAA